MRTLVNRIEVGVCLFGVLHLLAVSASAAAQNGSALVLAQGAAFDCDAGPDVATTGPTVVVLTPNPGDMLAPGGQGIRGAAFDCHADVGIGVDWVSVYLGNRDAGGVMLGEATLGAPSGVRVTPIGQFASAGWTLAVAPALRGSGTTQTLSVYARSTVTGRETVLVIPVMLPETPAPAAPVPANPPGAPGGVSQDAPPGDIQVSNPPVAPAVPPDQPDGMTETPADDGDEPPAE